MSEPDEASKKPDSEPAGPPQLTAMELRVLGVLMEKQLTTPDQYPLTVNSLLSGCNQKSSRDPVTHYHQGELLRTLQQLSDKHFVRKEYSSRADKYSQLFIKQLELTNKHQAVLCLMMLRGPQTLSELTTRTQRMELFTDKDDLSHCVERLCERAMPCVVRLSPQPGQRGERFTHLFDDRHESSYQSVRTREHGSSDDSPRPTGIYPSATQPDLQELINSVIELQRENSLLKQQLAHLYELTGHTLSKSELSKPDEST